MYISACICDINERPAIMPLLPGSGNTTWQLQSWASRLSDMWFSAESKILIPLLILGISKRAIMNSCSNGYVLEVEEYIYLSSYAMDDISSELIGFLRKQSSHSEYQEFRLYQAWNFKHTQLQLAVSHLRFPKFRLCLHDKSGTFTLRPCFLFNHKQKQKFRLRFNNSHQWLYVCHFEYYLPIWLQRSHWYRFVVRSQYYGVTIGFCYHVL